MRIFKNFMKILEYRFTHLQFPIKKYKQYDSVSVTEFEEYYYINNNYM